MNQDMQDFSTEPTLIAFPDLPHIDESYARDSWNYAAEWYASECPPWRESDPIPRYEQDD